MSKKRTSYPTPPIFCQLEIDPRDPTAIITAKNDEIEDLNATIARQSAALKMAVEFMKDAPHFEFCDEAMFERNCDCGLAAALSACREAMGEGTWPA